MFGVSVCGGSVFLAAERAAILLLGRPIGGDIAIANPVVVLPSRIAGGFRHGARRDGLADVAPILCA
jgi:hypothetical protein